MSQARSKRIADSEWEKHKGEIIALYVKAKTGLKGKHGLVELMRNKYGFVASEAQYEYRLKQWGIRKYGNKDHWRLIHEILTQRESINEESDVYISGRKVSKEKLKRERKRYRSNHPPILSEDRLPDYIRISTPDFESLATASNSNDHVQHQAAENLLSVTSTEAEDVIELPLYSSNNYMAGIASSLTLSNESHNWPYMIDSSSSLLADLGSGLSVEDSSVFFQSPLGSPLQFIPDLCGDWFDSPLSDIGQGSIALFPNGEMSNSLINFLDGLNLTASSIFGELARNSVDPTFFTGISQVMFVPETTWILTNKRTDLQLLYTSIAALANNSIDLENLRDSTVPMNVQIRKMIASLDKLGGESVKSLLETFPQPFRSCIEEGLFLAAVEIGAVRIVDALLDRNIKLRSLQVAVNGTTYTPLLRSCIRGDIAVIKSILSRSELSHIQHTFTHFVYIKGPNFEPPKAELFAVFLQGGLRMDSHMMETVLKRFNPDQISKTLVHNLANDNTSELYTSDILDDLFRICDHSTAIEIVISLLNPERCAHIRKDPDFLPSKLTKILNKAMQFRHIEAAMWLLSQNAQPNSRTLYYAVKTERADVVECVLEAGMRQSQDASSIFQRDNYMCITIAEALGTYQVPILDVLNRFGLMRVLKTDGVVIQMSISVACETGKQQLLEYLLSQRVVLNIPGKYMGHSSPYFNAMKNNHDELVPILIKHGIRPCEADMNHALQLRKLEASEAILDSVLGLDNNESLHLAIAAGYPDIIRSLVVSGASLEYERKHNCRFPEEWPVDAGGVYGTLATAIICKRQNIIDLLFELGAPINVTSKRTRPFGGESSSLISPLCAAINTRNNGMVHELLVRGAIPNDENALLGCVQTGNLDMLQVLLGAVRSSRCNSKRLGGLVALGSAISSGKSAMIQELALVTDINALGIKEGMFALSALGAAMRLAGNFRLRVIRELLSLKPDLNSLACRAHENRGGVYVSLSETPLVLAIRMRDIDAVRLLVSAGADTNPHPQMGVIRTPLQAAVEAGALHIVHFLLDQGAEVNAPPAIRDGRTALQVAAEKGFIGIASVLISAGALVNAPAGHFVGRTAFEAAAEFGRIEMLIFLADKGVDIVSDGGKQYRNSRMMAETNGHTGIIMFIEDLYNKQCLYRSAMGMAPLETGDPTESLDFDPRMFL
ncbi:unnamed protein product [Periconia digitata]|uniref:Clr5 domain-containing protein n=1 Tax=Periconia digitata TaxID=1303443 RepID=A0A9W4UK57_9PLEO|nr:unnamed protein product [Periconia digitata]